MSAKFQVGDVVKYTRNKDGVVVHGVVDQVYLDGSPLHRLVHFVHDSVVMDVETEPLPHNRLLPGEPAYRLWFTRETTEQVGHPVTIAESRLQDAPDEGVLLRLVWIQRPDAYAQWKETREVVQQFIDAVRTSNVPIFFAAQAPPPSRYMNVNTHLPIRDTLTIDYMDRIIGTKWR